MSGYLCRQLNGPVNCLDGRMASRCLGSYSELSDLVGLVIYLISKFYG
jgi:hypothetical protein